MNTNDFVIAMRPVNGIVKNSVGVIKSVSQEGILVYFIGKNEEVRVPFGSIAVIDIDNTGKGHKHKICNICHILKRMEMFDKNQRDAQQRSTTRPSCKICRQEIDGVKLTAQERRKMETKRPPNKTIKLEKAENGYAIVVTQVWAGSKMILCFLRKSLPI